MPDDKEEVSILQKIVSRLKPKSDEEESKGGSGESRTIHAENVNINVAGANFRSGGTGSSGNVETRPYILSGRKRVTLNTASAPEVFLFIAVIVVYFLDAGIFSLIFGTPYVPFARGPGTWGSYIAAYVFLAVLAAFIIKYEDESRTHAFARYIIYAFIAVFWPRVAGYVLGLIPRIGGTLVADFTFVDIVLIIATFFPFFVVLTYVNSRSYFRQAVTFIVVLIIFATMIFIVMKQADNIPGETTYVFAGSNGPQEYVNFLRDSTSEFFRNLVGFPMAVNAAVNRTINRFYEPYFTGEVEKSKTDTEIGVFLSKLEPAYEPILPTDQKIVVYAELSAKRFTGDVTIHTECFAQFDEASPDAKEPHYVKLQGNVDIPDLSFRDYESNTIMCTFNRKDITTQDSTIDVSFVSTFNFVTWGYAWYAFMDRDVLPGIRKDQPDFLQKQGISETVKATYTPGPLMLGMADAVSPVKLPVGIDRENPILPLFGVTLENSAEYWKRGKLTKINKLVFHVPKHMMLDPASCSIAEPSSPEPSEDGTYELYTFTNIPQRENMDLTTIRCRLKMNPGEIPEFLGPGGIAFAVLSAQADYEYELTDQISIKMAPPEAPR